MGSAIHFHLGPGGQRYRLEATAFRGRFGDALEREPQHELRWVATVPELPLLHHECHRWAVQRALTGL